MNRLSIAIVITLVSFNVQVLACDLAHICNHGNCHVINPDPSRYTLARVQGCETATFSDKNRLVTVKNCEQAPVTLQLLSSDGEGIMCPLTHDVIHTAVEHVRKRRSTVYMTSLQMVLVHGIKDGAIHYACHSLGVFIDNPRPELYSEVIGVSLADNSECEITCYQHNQVIWIHDCPMAGEIVVAMSDSFNESRFRIERRQGLELLNCASALPLPGPYAEHDSGDASFECFDSQTIVATNNRHALWQYSYAENNQVLCQTLHLDNNHKIVIFGCDMVGLTLLILSRHSTENELIIRPNNFFLIDCVNT